MAGSTHTLQGVSRGDRWRERWRFLLATLTLTLMYLAIREVWLWGAGRLARTGLSNDDVLPIPQSALIGMHGTLAAVPEPLWRPLTRLSQGDSFAARAGYRAAADVLDLALANGTSPSPPAPR